MMRFIPNSIFALLCAAIPFIHLNAQDFNMPYKGKLEVTAGEGFIYDNGGPTGYYQNYSSDTLVIRPEIPGRFVKLTCDQWSLDNYSGDYIEIYSSDSLINRFHLNSSDLLYAQFYAQDTSGSITIVFVSDESTTRSGFRFQYTTVDQPLQSDLSIKSLVLNNQEAFAGAHLQLTAVLFNLGPDNALFYSVDYYLSTDTVYDESDHFLGASSLPDMNVSADYSIGNTCYLTLPETTDTGSYYILGRITNVAGGPDLESTNSQIQEEIEIVEPQFDFHLHSISIASNLIIQDLPLSINFGVENNGGHNLSQALNTGFFLSEDAELDPGDFLLGDISMAGISTDHTYWNHLVLDSIDFSSISEGVHYLIAACDYNEMYDEINEDNNLFISQVLLYKSHTIRENLTLSRLQPAVDTLSSGQAIKVEIQAGTAFDSQRPTVDLYMSADSLLDSGDKHLKTATNITLLPSGTNAMVEITCHLNSEEGIIEGDYYIIAALDRENLIRENDESDNTGVAKVYVSENIIEDLGLGNISLNCDSLLNNQWLYVYADVSNNGSSKSVNGKLHCYLSVDNTYDSTDVLIDLDYFNYFDPGTTIRRGLSYTDLHKHDPGDYHILVMLDPLNEVDEVSESNNFGSIPLKLLDPEDVDRFDAELIGVVAPDTVTQGSRYSLGFSFVFYNDERGSLNASIYLSKDSVLNNEDLSSRLIQDGFYCSAYQEVEMLYNHKFDDLQDTGRFYLIVRLDDYNYLAEDDEDNNLLIQPIYVRQRENIPEGDIKILNTKLNSSILSSSNKLEGSLTLAPAFEITLDSVLIEFYLSAKDSPVEQILLTETQYNLRYTNQHVEFSMDLPDGIENGLYQLRCFARINQVAVDINPANNEEFAYFTVQDVDLDFTINQLRIDNYEYFQSESMITHFDVRNNGTTIPATPYCSFYISNDIFLSEEDLEIQSFILQDLGIQHTRNINQSLTLPQGIEPGSYYLIVLLDAEHTYPESDEENNIQAVPFQVLPNGPNLAVKSAEVNMPEIARGIPFTATFLMANTGNAYASSSYTGLYVSEDKLWSEEDIFVTSKYISSLSSNRYENYSVYPSLSTSIEPGSYYLLFVADMSDKINETNQSDNVFALPVTIVQPSFDLEISGLNIQDTLRTSELSRISLELKVTNLGEHPISDNFKIYSYISSDSVFDVFGDIYIGNQEVRSECYPEIPLDIYVTSYLPGIVGKGQYWLFYFLDAEGDIDEINEANNVYSLPVVITDLDVDIAVTDMELTSDTIPINTKIECSYTVSNIGTTYCLEFIRTEFYISRDTILDSEDSYTGYKILDRLDAQGEISSTVSIFMPPEYMTGRSYVIIKASSNGDENLENNAQYRSIYVSPPDYDLTMGTANLNPAESIPGQRINNYFWTSNIGSDDITRSFKVSYFFSNDTLFDPTDLFLGEEYFSRLSGNTTRSESVYFTVPQKEPGTYYIVFIADSENTVSETNENNNTSFVPFHIMAQGTFPDYSIENVNFSHDPKDNLVDIQFSVYNKGMVEGGTVTSCRFYASPDMNLEETDYYLGQVSIDNIGSEAEANFSFEGALPHKEYNYVVVLVDENELIEDHNRYNNIVYLKLNYELAFDLDLNCELMPEEIHPGDSLVLTTQILRQGSPVLDSVLISYYIGRDSILEFAERPILEKMLTLSEDEITMDYFLYNLPETVSEGSWYAMVVLNWDSVWIEQNSANNFVVLPFEVEQNTNHNGQDYQNSLEIKLFPNPTSDFIILESPEIMKEYSLTDLQGRILDNGKPMDTQVRIVVNDFPPGLYQLLIHTGEGKQVLRFVIE